MTTLREAAQQVLDAIESDTVLFSAWTEKMIAARTALRAALAQQAEPVLVVEKEPDYWSFGHFYQGSKPHIDPTKVWSLPIGTKLYTAPPQRLPLTDEVAALTAQRDALLEALKTIDYEFRKYGRQHWPEAVKARAAIKKAEGEKT